MALGAQNESGTLGDPNSMGLLAMGRVRKRDEKTKDLFAYAEDNRASIVYMATNILDGSRYIGITRLGLEKRRLAHMKEALYGRQRHTSRFYRAIRRDGESAFVFRTIVSCESYREAALEEIRLIAELKPEYNLSNGGEGASNVGARPSEETRKKMSLAQKGNPNRLSWLGKKRPDIAALQRVRMKGKKLRLGLSHSPETIEKLRQSQRRVGLTEKKRLANYRRRVPIVCLNDGRVFMGGAKEAAEAYGLRYDGITGVLCGKQRTTGDGYRFTRLRPEVLS